MSSPLSEQRRRQRDLVLFRTPALWSCWPFLPVVRLLPSGQGRQLGVLYDASHHCGRYGFSATVFLCNVFGLPQTREAFFDLPKLVYDTADEMVEDGGGPTDAPTHATYFDIRHLLVPCVHPLRPAGTPFPARRSSFFKE